MKIIIVLLIIGIILAFILPGFGRYWKIIAIIIGLLIGPVGWVALGFWAIIHFKKKSDENDDDEDEEEFVIENKKKNERRKIIKSIELYKKNSAENIQNKYSQKITFSNENLQIDQSSVSNSKIINNNLNKLMSDSNEIENLIAELEIIKNEVIS